jgi:AraC-like DNA-binding protein
MYYAIFGPPAFAGAIMEQEDSTVAQPRIPGWAARIMAPEEIRQPRQGTATQQALVVKAKRYLADRPAERVRLEEMGRALGVSPAHVTEVFKEVEGVPFHRYALRRRLERAARLLPTYASDLSTLAVELDFSSHSHFTTAFRRAFGCTPAAFRERARRICPALSRPASVKAGTSHPSAAAYPAHRAVA